jgi:hypothetical protein
MLKTKKFFLICLFAVPLVSFAQQRAASGPVERVDRSTHQITVLGQTFLMTAATRFAVNGRELPMPFGLRSISIQDSISIVGIDSPKGPVATLVELSRVPYVAGASPVYVLGSIEEYSHRSAEIRVGSLSIDASGLSPDLLSNLRIGATVEASGIQPNPTGKLVGPARLSIGGTGLQKQSTGGTGVRLQSIGGTGLQKQSIGGTGVQLQSIGGTGLQKQSIGGTGVRLQSIGGTGLQKQSIGGTGVQLQSIGGTGLQKQSIGGTGVRLQSIGGTGLQKQSIGGTGIRLQSIGGTGLQEVGRASGSERVEGKVGMAVGGRS